ncbi:MAG: 50S ribosomal protein L6 [Clostridia bacterium]|nr:50S ribosomal protein L6 [Clostridia bacterium]
MSRIGKLPVSIPAGVTITVNEGNVVTVKGPKGELTQQLSKEMIIEQEDGKLTVKRPSDSKQHRALHGLTRTLINNMVVGTTTGFTKNLEIVGVGYRAQMQGNKLVLNLGYSHPVEFEQTADIKFEAPAPTKIVVSGIDKQKVGQVAAEIRAVRSPEPYKGKGVRYEGEVVRRKEGKTGK